MNTSIAIVDDHSVLAESLSRALSLDPSILVVGTFTSAHECLTAIEGGLRVDVLMTDFSMPEIHGIELCLRVKKLLSDVKYILLTMHDSSELRHRSRRSGIDGFFVKTASIAEIRSYVLSIAQGLDVSPSESQDDSSKPDDSSLTPAEIEVIRCIICKEMSSREAADYLHRSHHTIEQHRKNIYVKLHLDSIPALTKYAMEAGICCE